MVNLTPQQLTQEIAQSFAELKLMFHDFCVLNIVAATPSEFERRWPGICTEQLRFGIAESHHREP